MAALTSSGVTNGPPAASERPGGAALAGDLMCDVDGCDRLTGFGTKQALGAHKWRAHGIRAAEPTPREELPSRAPEARHAERQRHAEAYGERPRLVDDQPVMCSVCEEWYPGARSYGGHLQRGGLCRGKRPTPVQHREDESEDGPVASTEEAIEVDGEVNVCVEVGSQDDADWLDSFAFLNGYTDATGYVAALVNGALEEARFDPDVKLLVEMRARRREQGD